MILASYDYDNHESWHLAYWTDKDDPVVIETMFITKTAAGICLYDTLEEFIDHWEEWVPEGSFCIPLDNVEVLKVIQEEAKSE